LPETWGATQKILNAFEWKQWRDIFPVRYHPVAKHKIVRLLMTPELTFAAVTVNHFVPTLAIRVTHRANHRVAVYSSDTAPSGALVELARGADLLLHEATALDQDVPGHSSAVNAGQVAQRAGVKQLVLLHLPPNVVPAQWRAAARRNFKGPIMVARDYDEFEL
jgi:ribonuclease BN (tRNA processing enzyme)